jgi:hypothetical protein
VAQDGKALKELEECIMESWRHALEEFRRHSIWASGLVRREAREAFIVQLRGDGRQDEFAVAFAYQTKGVRVSRVLPRKGRWRVCGRHFGQGGSGEGEHRRDNFGGCRVEAAVRVADNHKFTLGALV